MMPYKRTTAPEQVRQLFDDIEKYHEKFCRADDPEAKAEALRLMKACATEYLSKVVHSHKFKTAAVERVLAQSVHRSVDFDAREASEAFEHLAKYGQNLLEQPWREEFRFLSLSSGYYVHNIQAFLQNPHEILIAMGYANINDDVLQLATAPIPMLLKQISRDCFLASQECLILSKISDFVQTQTKYRGITPADIYSYRTKLTGDVKTIGSRICYDLHQRQYDEQMRKASLGGSQQQRYRYSQENCPVDELVDLSGGSGAKVSELPEREIVRKVLHNTQKEQEHIYDPVPAEVFVSKGKILSPNSPSINSSSSNFIYPTDHSPVMHPGHTNGYSYSEQYNIQSDYGLPPVSSVDRYPNETRSSSASPYIPKTVAAMFDPYGRDGVDHRKPSHSSSSSSSSRGQYLQHQALEKKKVPQEELTRRYPENAPSVLSQPNWLDVELEKQNVPRSQPAEYTRRPMNVLQDHLPASQPTSPRVTDSDGLLTEAYRYKHETSSLMKNRVSEKQLYGRPPYEVETSSSKVSSDSRVSSDRDSENKSSVSSDTSSWGFTKEPADRETLQWYGAQPSKAKVNDRKSESRPSNSLTNKNDSEVFETEYQRQFKAKSKPLETDLDSFETYNLGGSGKSADNLDSFETDYTVVVNKGRSKHSNNQLTKSKTADEVIFQVDPEFPPLKTQNEVDSPVGTKVSSEKSKNKHHAIPEDMEVATEAWSCPHCTYINHTDDKICGVCCKTRDFDISEEEAPLAPVLKLSSDTVPKTLKLPKSPSSDKKNVKATSKSTAESSESSNSDFIECPYCTLLNPKTRVLCEACEHRLKNNDLS